MPINAAALNEAVAKLIAADAETTTAASRITDAQSNHAKLLEARAAAHSAVVEALGN